VSGLLLFKVSFKIIILFIPNDILLGFVGKKSLRNYPQAVGLELV
jgi:hypothetical protein